MSEPAGEQFGPYLVYEQLGVGGMATVHRAETSGIEGFRRQVALKRMLPHIASNDDFVQSFVREARLASHLHHTNVAQTYDLGKVDDIYFIAMELVAGRTLRNIVRHAVQAGIHIPIPITLHILNQIADALDYAHNLCDDSGLPFGIIHRDVSPSNVIVADSGVVKLIDFGIAKASASGMQTLSGTIKGKFGYMAPEYLDGQLDSRADLFALGVIGHELLTAKPLFQGRDDMDTLARLRSMSIDPPSRTNTEVPHEIDAIVMTALQRDPEMRWQRASAMRMALTTEVQRLGWTLLDHQVVQWVDATFEKQVFDIDSQPPTRVLQPQPNLDTAPSIVIELVPEPEGHTRTSLRASQPLPLPAPLTPTPPPQPIPVPQPPDHRPSADPVLIAVGAPPLSGARTKPNLAQRSLRVGTEDVVAEVYAPKATAKPMGNLAIFVLLVLTAAAAAAVVYFGLPLIDLINP